MRSKRLALFSLAHLLAVLSDWAVIFGVLLHAFRWGGTPAVGWVSLAILAPALVCAPIAAHLTSRHRPHFVRVAGLAAQTAAFVAAAVASAGGAATPIVTIFVVIGIGAMNTLRPSGAALLPVIARSTDGLVRGNLWISYADSSCALLGSLLASTLSAASGPTAVFAAGALCTGGAVAATLWHPSPLELAPRRPHGDGVPTRVMREAVAELRSRPWAIGVLAVAAARNIIIGAFNVLLVILALRALDMGDGGPGLLSALVGGGAVVSMVVITVVVRRAKLRSALVGSLTVAAVSCVVLGVFSESRIVLAVLPVVGLCMSLMDNVSRMLLQRSTEPRRLGPLFACLGLVAGVAQLVGAIIAQALVARVDLRAALIGIGLVLLAIVVSSVRALRSADSHADIPVVEMSLMTNVSFFAGLPTSALEIAARSAQHVTVQAGEVLIRQDDDGDVFYVAVAGEFDIVMNGVLLRTATSGDFFGEVALLADMPRTATVTARGDGELLAIHRDPFLLAVTGHPASHSTAMRYVTDLDVEEKMRSTRLAASGDATSGSHG